MGLHKPFDRPFIVLGGSTMTSGGSLNLAKGQFGIFSANPKNSSVDGLLAVSSFAGVPQDERYYIKVGRSDVPVTRSQSDKSNSTYPFRLSDIKALDVSAPQITEPEVDEVILGYNGIDDATAITLKKGDRKIITLELSGEAIGLMGYEHSKVYIDQYIDPEKCYGTNPCEDCDNCEDVNPLFPILEVIEQFKDHKLRGNRNLTDFVDITPIQECATSPEPTEVPKDFQCLEVCDTGDSNALALVAAQVPGYKVTRISRVGATSTYQVLTDDGVSLPDFAQTVKSLIKGCEDCPAGYTEVEGGILYAVSLEDEGADESATVETLANAVAGTGTKQGQQDGVGFYTVVLSSSLSLANSQVFVTANPTSTIKEIGAVAAVCENATVTNISWAVCGTCNVIEEDYTLVVPDACNGSVLAELQEFYPDLVITETQDTTKSEITVTLTGTSGTANVNIGGVDYLATFNTDLATTVTDFIAAHGAAITTATGLTAAPSGVDGIVLTGDVTAGSVAVAVANVSGDLAGSAVETPVSLVGGCQRSYSTTVVSNLVCEECDPIFKDTYITEAPGNYLERKWVKVDDTATYTDCKVGIRFKGKLFQVFADECVKDEIGFIDGSVNVRVVGGFVTEVREGIGSTEDSPFNVEYLSRWRPRTHMGGNFYQIEDESHVYFLGEPRSKDDNVRKLFKGDESVLIPDAQYIDYALTVKREISAQSFGQTHDDNLIYHVLVEVGRHEGVEALLNSLAGAAGVTSVQATGV